ncbi:MFS transporter [Pseudomonas brassicacearum]|jgi:MFS family permease|uniref:MFS transporter n=1 Tax=Pseudomonas brassicacearum TaxID=930166 RepID=A0A423JN10_9PSED|nr:MFS transporter [Pseudomonas brassicacearum]RON39078.1 MFS transporter [Pseudomonas brassicacearum]
MNVFGSAGPASEDNRGSAYSVGLFLLCFAFSYLDRQIVSILVQPLKATLGLSDTQIGMLQGFSFTLCYATAGVVVARLVDRSNRVNIIAICVAIWACSTALCATAGSFSELLVWRAGTAIAEAALSPAVLSLLADLYAPRRLSRATGVFMLGPYIGSGAALTGGGALLGWLNQPGNDVLGATSMHAWQVVFLCVGLPGFLLAALVFFTVKEPSRREHAGGANAVDSDVAPPFSEVLRELFVRNRFCLPYFFGYACLIMFFYSFTAWFPTVLIRHFALEASYVGKVTGPIYMIGGVVGVLTAGLLVRRAKDAQALGTALKVAAYACTLLIPLALVTPLAPFSIAVTFYGLCAFAASIVMALAPIPLQIAIPNRMRGRSIALLVFMTNVIGGGVGPFAVGYISQSMADDQNGLGNSLAIVGTVSVALAAVLYSWATLAVGRSRVITTPAIKPVEQRHI